LSTIFGLLAGGFVFSVSPPAASASPAFTLRPGCAVDIGIGGGVAWIVGCNRVPGGFGIYRWNGSGWTQLPGGAIEIGVDPAGNAWVTNEFGDIYRWNGTGWVPLPGCALDIDVGANGTAWVTGCNRVNGGLGIYRWNGAGWVGEPGGGVWIGVDPGGNAWVTNEFGDIYRWNGTGWVLLPGCGNDIDVGANGTAWVAGCNMVHGGLGIYSWNGAGWVGQPGGALSIAVDATGNHPWVTNDAGQIFSS
jgi:hypothetical protein